MLYHNRKSVGTETKASTDRKATRETKKDERVTEAKKENER